MMEQPSLFKLFNTEALFSSNIQPRLDELPEPEFNFPPTLVFETPMETAPKKRGRKKKIVPTKDNFAPSITIKEIIENDKVGAPMEAEKLLNEQRSKMMRERKQNKETKEFKAVDLAPQPSNSSSSTANNAEETNFLGQPTLKIKDGKIVIEDNIAPLPSFKDKTLTVSKSKTLNSMSFRTKAQSKKWTEEEDKLFYKLLEIFGPDFSMIALVFGTRDRNQIKNKFVREDHKNRAKVDQALGRTSRKYVKALEGRFSAKPPAITEFGEAKTQPAVSRTDTMEPELLPISNIRNTSSTSSVDSLEMDVFRKINLILDKSQSKFERNAESATFQPISYEETKARNELEEENVAIAIPKRIEVRAPELKVIAIEEESFSPAKKIVDPVIATSFVNKKETESSDKPKNLFFL